MISISVTTLLWPLQNGENPYTFLRDLLRNELYPSPSGTIVGLCVAFSIVLAINVVAGLFCLIARFRRGERQLYRLLRSDDGTYILPSVILNGLLWSVISSSFALLSIWKATRTTERPPNQSLWLNLVLLPVFIGIWIVSIGIVVPALHRPVKPRSSWDSNRFFPTSSSSFTLPTFINLLLFCGIFFATFATTWIAILSTVRWNKGIRAWILLEKALEEIILAGSPRTGGARSVIFTIPKAEEWVSIMFANLYRFESGFALRLTLAAVAGTMMLVGGTIRIISLTRQLSTIRDAEKASIRASCIISTLMARSERKRELIGDIWRISHGGVPTGTIVVSMGVYCYVCISDKIDGQPSPIFLIDRSSSSLLYVVFFLATLQMIGTAVLLHQTLHPTAQRRRATTVPSSPTSYIKITPVSLSRSISTSSTFDHSSSGHSQHLFSSAEKSTETLLVEWPTMRDVNINRTDSHSSRITFPSTPAPSYSPRYSIRRVPPPVFSESDS